MIGTMMRALVAAWMVAGPVAWCGEIGLAVVRFPEPKSVEELEAALAGEDLGKLTADEDLVTKKEALRGGRVLFAQTLGDAAALSNTTRMGNVMAEVKGKLRGKRMAVVVTLSEGVAEGWGNHSARTYRGEAVVAGRDPVVLGVRTISGKTQSVVKGRSSLKETVECHVLLGQRR